MSFWADLKVITNASANAVRDGAALIASAAEQLEESSDRMLLKQKIRHLEEDFDKQKDNKVSSRELKEIWKTASLQYDELWQKTDSAGRQEITTKRNIFVVKIEDSVAQELEVVNENKRLQFAAMKFKLPIDEIMALKDLKGTINQLIQILARRNDSQHIVELSEECKTIESRIEKLEEKRTEVVFEHHPNKKVKARFRKHDGLLHGLIESWYPNGTKKHQAFFSDGEFNGKAQYWREDGSLLCEIKRDEQTSLEHKLLLADGQQIVRCRLCNKTGLASVWLWDGYYVGEAKMTNGQFNKAGFALVALLKPGFWSRMYRVKKCQNTADKLDQMEVTIDQWNIFCEELKESSL